MKNREIYYKIASEQPYCQLCGSTLYLEIHHIVYRSENGSNDERNLIRLCKKCHMMVHSNKKKWQPFLLNIQYGRYGIIFTKGDLKKKNGNNYNI